MSRQQISKWGIAIPLVMSLLSGCGGASPTPVVIAPASTPIPAAPPAVLPRATAIPVTVTTGPVSVQLTTTAPTPTGGTLTLEPSPTLQAPIDRPFLMKIDRISVIVGRGTLLEGRVANGTLQANSSVEILGPQNNVISATVLAILISNIMRDQVKAGDYAGILVGGVEATDLSPGMLLAEAGKYKSYEEALQQLQ
jgi:translation elongation factor EF-1alpha